MPWLDVFWTVENEAYLLEHGVSRDDAESDAIFCGDNLGFFVFIAFYSTS